MSQPYSLDTLLSTCTVRIIVTTTRGTGFFVGRGRILTCAHVVKRAYEEDVLITVVRNGQKRQATIVCYLPKPYPDLALLAIDGTEHPCVLLGAEVELDDNLYAYGYTCEAPEGDSAYFEYEGRSDGRNLLKLKAAQASRGLSGAPLLNRRTGAVCGVVKSTRRAHTAMGGHAVPVSTAIELMPELADMQREFHDADDAWERCAAAGGRYAPGRSLQWRQVASYTRAQLDEAYTHLGLDVCVERPEVVERISQASVGRALVVVHGHGGCGKSVALWQWARRVAQLPDGDGAFLAYRRADSVSSGLVVDIVDDFRAMPDGYHSPPDESAATALNRLVSSNPDLRSVVLYVALDGLDEAAVVTSKHSELRQLIQWFWKRDHSKTAGNCQATLVVSCRVAEDVIDLWMQPELSGMPYRGDRPPEILVGDFSREERIGAARSLRSAEVARRLESAIRLLLRAETSQLPGGTSPTLYDAGFAEPLNIDAEIVGALAHPVVWGLFCRMDEREQIATLEGKLSGGVDALAELVVGWFCSKVGMRRADMYQHKALVKRGVAEIASQTLPTNAESSFPYGQWRFPAVDRDDYAGISSVVLFEEARSSGLIVAGPGAWAPNSEEWHWRHAWVARYLARCTNG
jgi:hypothetical protein